MPGPQRARPSPQAEVVTQAVQHLPRHVQSHDGHTAGGQGSGEAPGAHAQLQGGARPGPAGEVVDDAVQLGVGWVPLVIDVGVGVSVGGGVLGQWVRHLTRMACPSRTGNRIDTGDR